MIVAELNQESASGFSTKTVEKSVNPESGIELSC